MYMNSVVDYFAAKLAFETDVSDVASALASAEPGFVLIDSRGLPAWDQGRIPGAIHLPTAELDARRGELDPQRPVVTYCWGPGCNGGTRSALAFARLGFSVREMIGGFEYWAREGLPVETSAGIHRRPVDPLTAPLTVACAC